MIRMLRRNASAEEIEEQKKQQKLRIKITKAARRSGKIRKKYKLDSGETNWPLLKTDMVKMISSLGIAEVVLR